MRKIILLNIVFAVLLVGCEKTIDFYGDKTDPIIVVNSIISPDSLFWVKVSKSMHITKPGTFPKVTDAKVDIFEQGNLAATLTHEKDGYYSDNFYPIAGKDYEIEVKTGETTVSAKTSIPEFVGINNLELEKVRDKEGNDNMELTIHIDDPAELKNYYKVSVLVKEEITYNLNEDLNTNEVYWTMLTSKDPVLLATFGLEDAFDNSPINDYNIFTDELINGKSYDLKVLTNTYVYDLNNEGEDVRKLKYIVYLSSISEEYFYYLKSRNINRWYRDDPFSEPVPVYSNIKGGTGILGAYSTSVDSISVTY